MRIASPEDASKVFTFLSENDYPHHEWGEDYLKNCLLVRIGTPAEAWGWWWFHWVDGADFVLEAHVCISKKRRARWMTPFVLDRLFACVDLVGAKTVLARPPCPAAARILQRMGFVKVGPFMTFDVKQEEDPYGLNV